MRLRDRSRRDQHFDTTAGRSVRFGAPVNHVAPGWFLQVAFPFDLPPVRDGAAQPVCYAGFDWDDIPEKSRWLTRSRYDWPS